MAQCVSKKIYSRSLYKCNIYSKIANHHQPKNIQALCTFAIHMGGHYKQRFVLNTLRLNTLYIHKFILHSSIQHFCTKGLRIYGVCLLWGMSPGGHYSNYQLTGPWEIWITSREVIFKLFSVNDVRGISCEIALRWMSLDFTDDKSTLGSGHEWLATTRQQAITWAIADPDLCHDMVSLAHN